MGDDIVCEIDDSGDGIPSENLVRLFETGFTSKNGTDRGYGLSTSSQLVNRAGGELHLEESELGGACFVVSLPKKEIRT